MPGKEWLKKLKACKKDRAVILILTGVLLLIIALPSGDTDGEDSLLTGIFSQSGTEENNAAEGVSAVSGSVSAAGQTAQSGESAALSQNAQSAEGTSFQNILDTLSDVSGQSAEEAILESRLAGILRQAEGVGEVEVMITLKSSGKKVVEKDTDQSASQDSSQQENGSSDSAQSSGSESTVFQRDSDGSETPYVTETSAPEIQGVLVIAQGADNSEVVTEITEAVMALFGTEAHKIKVMKME